jgi:hypothetical protein
MKLYMGMDKETDVLPAPRLAESSTADRQIWVVPDWQAPVGDGANLRVSDLIRGVVDTLTKKWMQSIASDLRQELLSENNPYPKVEEIDKNPTTILVSCPPSDLCSLEGGSQSDICKLCEAIQSRE